MGLITSFMSGKVNPTQWKNSLYGTLYDSFIEKEKIDKFEDFRIAVLEIINIINKMVPGRHFDVQHSEIKELFNEWQKNTNEEERKKLIEKFVEEKVNMTKADPSMMMAGLAAPPAAMVAKRTGEKLPQLKLLKAVPDVLFVPSATLLALAGFRLSKYWKHA